jgi:outer membrane protein assembly factor BamB
VFATPTVAGDLVFVGSCNGFFRALDKETGKERWTYDTRQDGGVVEFHSDPLVVGDLVIAGSDRREPGGVAHLYAFERATGKPRWKYRIDLGVAADVLRIGSNIYVVTLQDELFCLDWKTGELVWKSATGRPNDEFFLNSAPAASGDRVFFGGLDGTVYAFDASSGQILWKRELGSRVSTSLLFADGSLFAGTSNRHLYRLDPKTGSATADFSADEAPARRLLLADRCLLVFFGEQTLACLDSSLKAVRWRESTSGPWSSSRPYLWDHAVIAGNERGEVFAFRPSDGSRLWSQKFDGVIRGIGSSEGTLYVGTLKGMVFASRTRSP